MSRRESWGTPKVSGYDLDEDSAEEAEENQDTAVSRKSKEERLRWRRALCFIPVCCVHGEIGDSVVNFSF